jgi:hypothetical protein
VQSESSCIEQNTFGSKACAAPEGSKACWARKDPKKKTQSPLFHYPLLSVHPAAEQQINKRAGLTNAFVDDIFSDEFL